MEQFSLYIFTFYAFVCFVHTQEPKVSSSLGEIIGNLNTVSIDILPYRNVHEYLGIPFAQPPVGDRRFRKPEPKTNLDSPFYAQNHGATCPQSTYSEGAGENEDCLFLNVYVPDRPADEAAGHAVMIWVYGGGFQDGTSNIYDGSLMAVAGNVIVVTFNYRLGVFGFLSTGDDNAPGNFGLWDQRLVFQWVQDYIGDFGGDNQRVTIAGESAGAMSTIQHALTPDNHGLFQRVIAQSGSMSMPAFDLERDGMRDTVALANRLGCPTPMDELMYCLRTKSIGEYMTSLISLGKDISFVPIVDNDLIKINPQHISKMSEDRNLEEVEFFRSLDILSGFNSHEGAYMLPYIIMDRNQIEDLQPTQEEMGEKYLPNLLKLAYRKDFRDELKKVVHAQYTNWTNPNDYESIRLHMTKIAGDTNFAVPAIEMARLHKKSSASRNFMYFFTPVPSVRTLPTPSWIPGANHADEILFVFGGIGYLGVGTENVWEINLILTMMTYWTNFVKSGDPNLPEPMSPYWPEYTTDKGDYIVLEKSMTDASVKQHLYAEEANFWLEVFPDLVEAVEGKGTGTGCEHHTSAAKNVNVSKATAFVSVMILCFVSVF